MKVESIFVLMAVVYVAPHLPPTFGRIAGAVCLLLGVIIHLASV